MGRVYVVDGKKCTFDEVSYTVGKEQVFKFNGVVVRLNVKEGDGDKRFMEFKMPETSRDKANSLLSSIYAVLEKRVKDGEALKLEQATMLQLHYNEALRAEDMARGLSGGRTAVRAVVNENDLSAKREGVKLNMDLKVNFPWIADKNSREYRCLQQIENYRKIEYFPDDSLRDALAAQRLDFERRMETLRNEDYKPKSTHSSLIMRMLEERRA